jgi:hypothetical protein
MSFFGYCSKYGGNCMYPRDYIEPIERLWKNVFVYEQQELRCHPRYTIERMCKFIGVPTPQCDIAEINKSFANRKIKLLRIINYCTFGLYNMAYAKVVSW